MSVDNTIPAPAAGPVPVLPSGSAEVLAQRVVELEAALAAEKARADRLRQMLLALAEEDAPPPLTAEDVSRVLAGPGRERLEDILAETERDVRGAQ
jgi:hypothetical protein